MKIQFIKSLDEVFGVGIIKYLTGIAAGADYLVELQLWRQTFIILAFFPFKRSLDSQQV